MSAAKTFLSRGELPKAPSREHLEKQNSFSFFSLSTCFCLEKNDLWGGNLGKDIGLGFLGKIREAEIIFQKSNNKKKSFWVIPRQFADF